jgi:hypothetical protein
MYITCKNSTANLRLIDNLIILPDCLWRALLTDFIIEPGSLWTEAAIDCLRAVSGEMISVACCHTNFNLYKHIKDC